MAKGKKGSPAPAVPPTPYQFKVDDFIIQTGQKKIQWKPRDHPEDEGCAKQYSIRISVQEDEAKKHKYVINYWKPRNIDLKREFEPPLFSNVKTAETEPVVEKTALKTEKSTVAHLKVASVLFPMNAKTIRKEDYTGTSEQGRLVPTASKWDSKSSGKNSNTPSDIVGRVDNNKTTQEDALDSPENSEQTQQTWNQQSGEDIDTPKPTITGAHKEFTTLDLESFHKVSMFFKPNNAPSKSAHDLRSSEPEVEEENHGPVSEILNKKSESADCNCTFEEGRGIPEVLSNEWTQDIVPRTATTNVDPMSRDTPERPKDAKKKRSLRKASLRRPLLKVCPSRESIETFDKICQTSESFSFISVPTCVLDSFVSQRTCPHRRESDVSTVQKE